MANWSKRDITREAIRRKRAKDSLVDFAQYIDIPGVPTSDEDNGWELAPVETGVAAHHALIMRVMQGVFGGTIPRAMLFLPPGSAKSSYGSVVFPAWAMGKRPGFKVILASYGSDLAKKHGRRARQIVRSHKFQNVFATSISADTGAADFWALENGSEYMAGGILSGITGNRCQLLLIDDPVKGREEADSETIQKKTWEAYQDDLRTRLVPGGSEIIIQTRWSENDLSGKILPEDYDGQTGLIKCRDGRDWYVVCLPAQCERSDDPLGRNVGEYLWPEWFTEEHFEGFKAQSRTWSALFQQRPDPPEGTFFKKEWFLRYRPGDAPLAMNHYLTSDHAPGGEDHNDFNCFRVWGVDQAGEVWLRGGFRAQETIDKSTDKAIALIKVHKPFCWFPEDDNNWKAVSGFVAKELNNAKAWVRIEPVSPHGQDKPTKAQAFQALASCGMVHIPEGPEGDEIISQYLKFPAGAHDDEVDAASIIGRVINEAHPAIVKKPKEEPKTQAQEDFDVVFGIKRGRGKVKDDWFREGAAM
jgi:predicted phage terminase large subunit-like protein